MQSLEKKHYLDRSINLHISARMCPAHGHYCTSIPPETLVSEGKTMSWMIPLFFSLKDATFLDQIELNLHF